MESGGIVHLIVGNEERADPYAALFFPRLRSPEPSIGHQIDDCELVSRYEKH
jgi:hypothetical protein